jgi:hypothetical protein
MSGCSSVSVRRDYDESADFAGLQAYAWKHDVQPETGNPRLDNDLLDTRIRNAVDDNLSRKGFRRVDASEADFLVEYFIGIRSRITGSGGTVSMGMTRSSGGRAGTVGLSSGSSVREVDEAHLTVDILDASSGQTIWRGTGSRTASSSTNPQRITDRVNDAVKRILAKFPPQ